MKTHLNRLLQFKITTALIFIVLALACFGLLSIPKAFGTDLDGVLPNNNTADGTNVLISLTTGVNNSGFGFEALKADTVGSYNTAIGVRALFSNTGGGPLNPGFYNTATGAFALAFNVTGYANTANGYQALYSNSSGGGNVASGDQALFSNKTGYNNTATGIQALYKNTASSNTATGCYSLHNNTTGSGNTAAGYLSLANNTTGSYNTAVGEFALDVNTDGSRNTAMGDSALYYNGSANDNVAIGYEALRSNNATWNTATGSSALRNATTGGANTANGYSAMYANTQGYNNTATGFQALYSNIMGYLNTANGYEALLNSTGAGNTGIGYLAGQNLTTGDDNICIGNDGFASDAGVIRIGRSFIGATYIAGISGQSASGGAQVYVNSDGKLGTSNSSLRFKDQIKPMDKASEMIFALRPVTFRYKKDIDPKAIPQFGLVAEDVERVNADLVVRDADGKPYSVRYEQINAMLLNEFLKEHRRVDEQDRKIQEQETTMAELKSAAAAQEAINAERQKQIRALAVGLQKVSAQLEMSKPPPQMSGNNR